MVTCSHNLVQSEFLVEGMSRLCGKRCINHGHCIQYHLSGIAATQTKMQLRVSFPTFIYLLPNAIILNGVAY